MNTPPTRGSLVTIRNGQSQARGIVEGVEADPSLYRVRWLPEQRVAVHHGSTLTSALKPGIEVMHEGSHHGMESLGHGKVLETREVAGQVQHLVEFWQASERRWLPWQRLRPVDSVDAAFGRLPGKAGDAEALRLRNLAYALSEWNLNTGGLSRLEIEPLPHQLYLVNRILASGDLNWLIADDVGLGKTIEVGLLLAALRQRKYRRFLIVVPAGLTRQWEEELRDKFLLDDFVIYGETAMPETAAQWRLYDRVIVSMDRAKHEKHLPNILHADDWDLVVVDEAHRLSRREWGTKFVETERYEMAEALRRRTDAMLLLTGTPHQGKDDMFRGLLELLRPGQEWRQRFINLKAHPEILSSLVIRNRKADVTDEQGEFIFRGKTSTTIGVMGSDAEAAFERDLVRYFRDGYAAGASRGQRGMAIGFVMTTFRKLAASSLAAIAKSLHRRAERLRLGLNELAAQESVGECDNVDERFVESDEELTGEAREFFSGELQAVEQLAATARALVPHDSKVTDLFERVIPNILQSDQARKVLLFTEYRTTQDVIARGLVGRFGAQAVATIHGGQGMLERRKAVDSFNDDCQFLVSTEAGGEGLNLHRRCNVMVNFDLPWNPMRLVQRVGRLYRYGQTERVVVFNMKAAQTVDQEILSGMYERLDRVAADLATLTGENREGLIEDILGQLIGALDVQETLETALLSTEDRSEERIQAAIARAQEAAKAQDQLLRFAAGFDPGAMEGRIHLTKEHLKSFTESILQAQGIELAGKLYGGDVWDLRLPESWQTKLSRRQNLRISFDRAKATVHKAELFDGDHPLLTALLQAAKNDPKGRSAVLHFPGFRLGYSALVRWLDESGRPVDSEYLGLLQDADGEWRINDDAWGGWLLQPAINSPEGVSPPPDVVRRLSGVIADYVRQHGAMGAVPDSHFAVSGFVAGHTSPP